MKNFNNHKKKRDLHNVLESVIKKCVNDILKILTQNKDEDFNFFNALDNVLESYNLEDEIIIKYEEELLNSGFKNKNLSLNPNELDIIKQKIKDQIYKNYIEKFENKKH